MSLKILVGDHRLELWTRWLKVSRRRSKLSVQIRANFGDQLVGQKRVT